MLPKKYLLFLPVILLSCATPKWKNRYISHRLSRYYEGFEISGNSIQFQTTGREKLTNKPFERMTRRDIKDDIKIMEKIFALIPDSVSTSNYTVDSFYFNKNKIAFIKRNELQSALMHFLE